MREPTNVAAYVHVDPDRHAVPRVTLTRPWDGASLCAVCMRPVRMTAPWVAYYEEVIAEHQRKRHASLIDLGYTPDQAREFYPAPCTNCPH